MTDLGCNVKSCEHNKDNCCCLSSIQVTGSSACNCDNTCCSSYDEASKSASNSAKTPKLNLSIACEAVNCIYNEEKRCNANHVDISGVCATNEEETVCATFSRK